MGTFYVDSAERCTIPISQHSTVASQKRDQYKQKLSTSSVSVGISMLLGVVEKNMLN